MKSDSPQYFGSVPYEGIVCPQGCPDKVIGGGVRQTLVGFFGGEENDPNHFTQSCKCSNCQVTFLKHWVPKGKRVWYTQDEYCIAGSPGCCATSYLKPCDCGGWQKHSTPGRGSFTNVEGHWVSCHPLYWECQQCHQRFPDLEYGERFIS